jgi:hypothetical protein
MPLRILRSRDPSYRALLGEERNRAANGASCGDRPAAVCVRGLSAIRVRWEELERFMREAAGVR